MTDVRPDPLSEVAPDPVTDEVVDPVTDADPDISNGPGGRASLGTIVAGHHAEPAGAFDMVADDTATAGHYLAQPASVPATTTGDEIVSIPLVVEHDGDYSLWARLRGPDTRSDAGYLGFDGVLHRTFTSEHGVWTWVNVTRQHLSAGANRIGIGYGEPGLQIDVFVVVSDASIGAAELEAFVVDGTLPERDHSGEGVGDGTDDGTDGGANTPSEPTPTPTPTEPSPTPSPTPTPTPTEPTPTPTPTPTEPTPTPTPPATGTN
ncbi:MAG: hypothetical protein H0U69_02620, partial [Trueperaceae bacterium]|nr:hypothetical protein [Trueperaceae bacterium]